MKCRRPSARGTAMLVAGGHMASLAAMPWIGWMWLVLLLAIVLLALWWISIAWQGGSGEAP